MDCVFCKIAKEEVPCLKIFEDKDFLAVFDVQPANPGHFIVFPKEHKPFLTELKIQERSRIFSLAVELAKKVMPAVNAEGFNIVYSAGNVAGQATPHMIVHVIPRFKDDKVEIKWESSQVSEELYRKIMQSLSSKKPEKKGKKKPQPKIEKGKPPRRLPGYW